MRTPVFEPQGFAETRNPTRLDDPELFLLNGFFRWPDLELLNLVLTLVSSVLSLLLRRLCLLHRGLPLLFLASEVLG